MFCSSSGQTQACSPEHGLHPSMCVFTETLVEQTETETEVNVEVMKATHCISCKTLLSLEPA